MGALLHDCFRTWARLTIMLLRLNPLLQPELVNVRYKFRRRTRRRVNPVVMIVEHDGDVQLLAEWKEVVDVVAELVVLEDQSTLDIRWQLGVVPAETGKCGFFVSEDTCNSCQYNVLVGQKTHLPPMCMIITESWSRPILSIISQ